MNTAIEINSLEDGNSGANTTEITTKITNNLADSRILLAHENPQATEHTKTLFKQIECSVQLHRTSSIEDLQDSLKQNEWDIIICYADSTLFMPAIITKHIELLNIPPRAIYIDDVYSSPNASQIILCGFSDYLIHGEDERLLFSISRETAALKDHRVAATSETVLAEANAKSQLLLDSTADAIAYIADGMLIHANNTFVETLGFVSVQDIELQSFIDLVSSNDQSTIKSIIKKLGRGEEDISDTQLNLLMASGDELLAELAFASASHDGEACTQIILRANDSSITVKDSGDLTGQPEKTNASSEVKENNINNIKALEGKGLIGFVTLCNISQLRKNISICEHQKIADEILDVIKTSSPDHSIVSNYYAESWIIATPTEQSININEIADNIINAIEKYLKTHPKLSDNIKTAGGFTKFGIANLSAEAALNKAFQICAEQQQTGGVKIFAPKIDNAEGSAALKSAMELDRLLVKFQPIIGLHNQSAQNYEACVFLRNDSDQEQWATQFIESLGLEKENVALDHWIINEAISSLSAVVYDNPNIRLTIPITASALVDDSFISWVMEAAASSGVTKECITFNVSSDHIRNFEQQAKSLLESLKQGGFSTSISNIDISDTALIHEIQPSFARLATNFTENLSADPEQNSRDALKELVQATATTDTACIATGVNAAAELAQLWQTGIPYVQGNYLQTPLVTMNYEFSDIA